MGGETQPEMRLGARGINLNSFGLGGLNAGWVFWGIRRTRGQVGFDGGRMKTSPACLWCRSTPIRSTSGSVQIAALTSGSYWRRSGNAMNAGFCMVVGGVHEKPTDPRFDEFA